VSGAVDGIRFVTDDKGRKTAVLIDLKRHGELWEDFWDGLVSESRRMEKSIPYEEYRANRLNRGRPHGLQMVTGTGRSRLTGPARFHVRGHATVNICGLYRGGPQTGELPETELVLPLAAETEASCATIEVKE
jgi:hypothetical protein